MVRREQCPHCKGNRYIPVTKDSGKEAWIKCPTCGGQGFKIRLTH